MQETNNSHEIIRLCYMEKNRVSGETCFKWGFGEGPSEMVSLSFEEEPTVGKALNFPLAAQQPFSLLPTDFSINSRLLFAM